jgi:murein DD-endopeptidase MepM/ murein hydrolase activator NlpD
MRPWLPTLLAAGTVAVGAAFTLRGEWPWPRLHVAPPIVISEAWTEEADTLLAGETVGEMLQRRGVLGLDLGGLGARMGLDPRRVRAGLVFNFRRSLADSVPESITVRTSPERRLRFVRAGAGWSAEAEEIRWWAQPVRVVGDIESSLYTGLDAAIADELLPGGERTRLAWDIADVFAWQVDFSRDVREGDHFEVLLEREVSDEGEVRFGRVLAAELRVGGRELSAFRFAGTDGRTAFYDGEGRSLRRAFLKAPVQFRRISSRPGMRRHPILGTVRRHAGTDYSAAPGTPVLAAGNGVVLRAGWAGGYGNLVELRHANGITTRYGHLRGVARGVRAGTRVSQGDVIGYVGSTGLSTAPHLHYEFRVNDQPRDPGRLDLGGGEPIPTARRAAFAAERDRLLAGLRRDTPPEGWQVGQ